MQANEASKQSTESVLGRRVCARFQQGLDCHWLREETRIMQRRPSSHILSFHTFQYFVLPSLVSIQEWDTIFLLSAGLRVGCTGLALSQGLRPRASCCLVNLHQFKHQASSVSSVARACLVAQK